MSRSKSGGVAYRQLNEGLILKARKKTRRAKHVKRMKGIGKK